MYKLSIAIALAATAASSLSVSAQVSGPAEHRAGASVSPAAQAMIDEDNVYLPRSQWSLQPAIDGCAVQRDFYLVDDHITFVLKRLQPKLPIEYALIGGGFDPKEGLEAGFVPGTDLAHYRQVGGASAGQREGVFFTGPAFPMAGESLPEDSLSSKTRYFIAQDGADHAVVLRTGRIDLALEALNDCAIEQLARLGVDWDERESYSRHPSLTNYKEISEELLFAALRFPDDPSDLTARFVVSADGEVTHCTTSDRMKPRALREAACRILEEQGSFEPALDREGNAVADFNTLVLSVTMNSNAAPGADGTVHRARD